MRNAVRVGVVGCGYWGPNLVRNFRMLGDCSLKMMCDVSEERLKHLRSLYPEVEGETDFNRMLVGGNLDAVVIATSVKHHYSMARASLLAGKHTFIEKPMASKASECEDLVQIARAKGLVLMVGHTFLYSPAVRKIKAIVDHGDIGDIRYISARRLNLGLFQKDINVAWDLAPHDISIILHIMGEMPVSVNCRGSAHVTPGIEDVTSMCLSFTRDRSAIVHSSWLDPRKIREMTIVGSKRMIVYDDVAPLEKIRIFDARVERPPHYDTFGEFHYAYHYGDVYAPYIKQEEPLKTECQHFLDCIREAKVPLSDGLQGLELVNILEASSESLRMNGSPVVLTHRRIEPAIGPHREMVLPGARRAPAVRNGNGAGNRNGNGNGNGHGNGKPASVKEAKILVRNGKPGKGALTVASSAAAKPVAKTVVLKGNSTETLGSEGAGAA